MRHIYFNLGANKQLNYIRMLIIGVLTALICTFFIKAGINNIVFLNSKTTEKQSKIDKLTSYIDKVSKNENDIKNEISKNKTKWEPRIKFINSLIHKKTFSFLHRLNKLEKLMPDRAYLKSISVKYGSKNRIIIQVESNSYETLLEVYKVFGKLNLKFGKETTKDNKYISTMSLVIKDE